MGLDRLSNQVEITEQGGGKPGIQTQASLAQNPSSWPLCIVLSEGQDYLMSPRPSKNHGGRSVSAQQIGSF